MDKSWNEALDDWEKEAAKLADETKKLGKSTSKELDKQIKSLQDRGDKLIDSIKKGDSEDKIKLDLERRYNVTRDKLRRAVNELKK